MRTISRLNTIPLKMERDVFERRGISVDVQRSHAVGPLVLPQLLFEKLGEIGRSFRLSVSVDTSR